MNMNDSSKEQGCRSASDKSESSTHLATPLSYPLVHPSQLEIGTEKELMVNIHTYIYICILQGLMLLSGPSMVQSSLSPSPLPSDLTSC